jgi:plasmid stabilization system protein ParE
MSRNRLEYHQGAIADAKSAVAWYKKHSPKAASDFIEELCQAAETILAMPDLWPPGKNNNQTLSAMAVSIFCHLFAARIRSHDLGCGTRQQAAGVLAGSAIEDFIGVRFMYGAKPVHPSTESLQR